MSESTTLDAPVTVTADEGNSALRATPGLSVAVGELLGVADGGQTALVRYAGQAGVAALRARTAVDLRGTDIGREVVLLFEQGDPSLPIVTGLLRNGSSWPLQQQPGRVEVDVDGERMIVSAKEELVLRCGKASITLSRSGKVVIQGSSVLSRATGSNRVKGGSVQLN
jgi:hypothetical protein